MIVGGCELLSGSGHDGGRTLLEALYRMEAGKPLPEIRTMPRGKPYFVDSDLHFSITHTHRHVFCVLSHCNVGIDAEEIDRPVRQQSFQRILSPGELARIEAEPDKQQAFLRMWVLKEAAVKLTGEGLQGFPNHTDFSPQDNRIRQWMGCYIALLSEDAEEGVTFYAF